MSWITGLLEDPLTMRLGWALLHSLWQAALLGALLAGLRLAMLRCSANARYIVACVFLMLITAAPVLTIVFSSDAASHASLARSDSLSLSIGGSGPVAVEPYSDGAVARAAGTWAFQKAAPWLVIAWLVGVGTLSVRWVLASSYIRRVKTTRVEPLQAAVMLRLEDLKLRLEVSRPVHLLKSALVEVPTVVGWLRPVILLPASTLAGLSPAQLDAILAHELAHVRRHDYLINFFQCLVETLMFYHPVVWWVSKCIREEREQCCDDLVMRVCDDHLEYARALVALEDLRAMPGELALAASGGSLLARIRRLLGHSDRRPLGLQGLGGIALALLGAIVVLIGVVMLFGPQTYRARALIRVEQPEARGAEQDNLAASSEFLPTECVVMRSHAVLSRVVADLNLREKWRATLNGGKPLNDAETLARLRSQLRVAWIPKTTAIEIEATSRSPEEAAAIANGMAKAYDAYRQEQRDRTTLVRIKVLEKRFDEYSQRETLARERAEKLRLKLKVPDTRDENGSWPAPKMNAETLRRIEGLRIESQAEYTRQAALLEKLQALDVAAMPQVLSASGVKDELLEALLKELNKAAEEKKKLEISYTSDHPLVKAGEAQKRSLEEKTRERMLGVLKGLEARVHSMKVGLESLQAEIQKAVQLDIEQAKNSRPYTEAMKELDELQRSRETLTERLNSERSEHERGNFDVGPVEVIEAAMAPPYPVKPNRVQALILVLLGLALGTGGIILAGKSGSGTSQIRPVQMSIDSVASEKD